MITVFVLVQQKQIISPAAHSVGGMTYYGERGRNLRFGKRLGDGDIIADTAFIVGVINLVYAGAYDNIGFRENILFNEIFVAERLSRAFQQGLGI